jgi:hydroxyacylglutathione hydrolase
MARVAEINKMRQLGQPTVPSMLGVEKRTNPFLRCDISAEIRKNVGASPNDPDAIVFGKVRRAKDTF